MAARQHLARWATALCFVTAGTVHFAAQAEALEARVGVQLPPLPLPVSLPTDLAIRLALPDFSVLISPPAQPITVTDPSGPQAVPAQTMPPSPAAAPASPPTALPLAPISGPVPTTVPPRPPPPPPPPLSLPLALMAALTGFLALQAFMDRRDPKLAAAPVGDEVLSFR